MMEAVENRTDEPLPVLVLREELFLPFELKTTSVERDMGLAAVRRAAAGRRRLVCVTQREKIVDDPASDELPRLGVIATLLDLDEGQGVVTIVLRGGERIRLAEFVREVDRSWSSRIVPCPVTPASPPTSVETTATLERLGRQLGKSCPPHGDLGGAEHRIRFAYSLAASVS